MEHHIFSNSERRLTGCRESLKVGEKRLEFNLLKKGKSGTGFPEKGEGAIHRLDIVVPPI